MGPLHALLLISALAAPLHGPARRARRPVDVAAVRTPIGEKSVLDVLDRAHVEVARSRAPRARLLMVWSLVALENGRGKKVFGNNLGNLGDATRTKPRFKLRDGGYYQAFPTPAAGAARLWTVLRRCKAAMAAFDAGDGGQAGLALRRCGYHRTDPGLYGASLRSLYREATTRWPVQGKPVRRHRVRPTLYARHEVN